MTSLSLSARRNPTAAPSRSLGVSLAPSSLDERVRLYLYRETVSREFIDKFTNRAKNDTDAITVDLWSVSDAWRITSDAKTMSALFLLHELRYHGLMPRYRPPRDPKRSPRFTDVAKLDPNRPGCNLRVKVVEALKMVPHPTRQGAERGVVLVGDKTGVASLGLEPSQTSLTEDFNNVDAPLFLRNVQFDMSSGFLTIRLDDFGKASPPSEDERAQFNFQPDVGNNVSATEYIRVYQSEGYVPNTPTTDGGRSNRGRPRGQARNGY
ncbi:uncharacterized protein LOC129617801 [Condylostylus longicornis]|uniref:uncharacterized protein LOC129617801 n=1 Tax=Condylostylus longicornis TaxID=2530218 RepID=UPI00244DA888|nr:uncharacterized protein LOC129617801 [Condylostylus longicornis]